METSPATRHDELFNADRVVVDLNLNSKAGIYSLIKKGLLSPPLDLGYRTKRWSGDDILACRARLEAARVSQTLSHPGSSLGERAVCDELNAQRAAATA